jgi:hypothetical protein
MGIGNRLLYLSVFAALAIGTANPGLAQDSNNRVPQKRKGEANADPSPQAAIDGFWYFQRVCGDSPVDTGHVEIVQSGPFINIDGLDGDWTPYQWSGYSIGPMVYFQYDQRDYSYVGLVGQDSLGEPTMFGIGKYDDGSCSWSMKKTL